MKYKSISVFFPALNEQENISYCLTSAKQYLEKRFKDYEMLVVINGSTDNTEKIVREFSKKDKRIIIVNDKKRGYGAALRSGFSRCTKELIFYTDSDNQFAIEDLDKLLPLLPKYDIVSGFREKRKDPLMRIFIADVYNLVITLLFNPGVKDIDCSFKLYKKKVIDSINLKARTGLIDAEVLIKAKKKGFTIGQVGVTHYPRLKGRTSYEIGQRNSIIAIVPPRVVIDIFKEIKILWQELR